MTERLKEETRQLHEQVEAENPARFIVDHSIDMKTYRLLLLQNYLAYKKTELAISQVLPAYKGEKHRQLEMDLEYLQIQKVDVPIDFMCKTEAEAYGAAYVVEGSALGGMVLSRHLGQCPELSGIEKHHFFNGDRINIKEWNRFKKALSEKEFSEAEKEEAVKKAKETFRFFGEIFGLDLLKNSQ